MYRKFIRIFVLIIKELLAILRDKRSRMAIIVPPLIQLLVFTWAATLDVKNASLAVFNQDTGRWSTELVQRFTSTDTFANVTYIHSDREINQTLDEQRALCVLVLPSDFSRRIDDGTGDAAQAQFLLDGRKTNSAQIVAGYATNIMAQFNADIMREKTTAKPLTKLPEIIGAQIAQQNRFNPNLNFIWYTLPSLFCLLILLVTLIVTSMSVAREREMGTFEQLLVSPLRTGEILAGKAGSAMIISSTEATLFLIISHIIFNIPFEGDIFLLYAGLFAFVPAIIGIGLFISSLSMTQQQAMLGTFVFMTPAMMLSGFATPIDNMPNWLQPFTNLNPLTYFLIISRGIFLKDMPWNEVWPMLRPMILIAATTLTAAAWLFRKRME